MRALLFQLSYGLQRYRWLGAPLQRWLAVALLITALLMATRALPGGGLGALLCLLLIPLFYLWQRIARASQFVHFRRETTATQVASAAAKLDPSEKIALHATGLFEVGDKTQRFTELPAYFRSFGTREHAVMATVQPRPLLGGLLRWPENQQGMWYLFFKNNGIREIQAGVLAFGSTRRPALRVYIEQSTPVPQSPSDAWGLVRADKAKPNVMRQTVLLSFDDVATRDRVWENLEIDAAPAHFT